MYYTITHLEVILILENIKKFYASNKDLFCHYTDDIKGIRICEGFGGRAKMRISKLCLMGEPSGYFSEFLAWFDLGPKYKPTSIRIRIMFSGKELYLEKLDPNNYCEFHGGSYNSYIKIIYNTGDASESTLFYFDDSMISNKLSWNNYIIKNITSIFTLLYSDAAKMRKFVKDVRDLNKHKFYTSF